jgi:hypothetical protein
LHAQIEEQDTLSSTAAAVALMMMGQMGKHYCCHAALLCRTAQQSKSTAGTSKHPSSKYDLNMNARKMNLNTSLTLNVPQLCARSSFSILVAYQ